MSPAVRIPEFAAGLALTLGVHAALVGLLIAIAGFGGEDKPETLLLPVVSAELLMWGEVMPEPGELPWIANPAPAPRAEPEPEPAPEPEPTPQQDTTPPPQETVVLNRPEPEPTAQPRQREENRARPEEHRPDAAPRRDRGEHNPNRPVNDRPIMGSPDGYVGGTSLSAQAMQNQFAGLVRQLGSALRRPAGIPETEFRRLGAVVDIQTTPSGQITRWEFVERSGNQLFDDAITAMLNRFRMGADRLRLSTVSDENLRNHMINQGFRIPIRGN